MIDSGRYPRMKKSISISIRVSEEELDKFKQAARLEAYASYSEFVRRTALIEAEKVIKKRAENESK
nr:MAG TPA: NikA, BACTERIAL CONJUGATION, RELAXASE, DNA [Caudoviricetes sp.]